MSKTPFKGRILVLGCGSVAQCTLPLLLRHLDVSPERVTILDFVDCRKALAPYLPQGLRFVREVWRPRLSTDRKSTRLNSSHQIISYAVFCLKKKKNKTHKKLAGI